MTTINLPKELLEKNYLTNEEIQRESLPYAIAINDITSGLFIPLSQMQVANMEIPPKEELTKLELLETDSLGLFLTEIKITILEKSPTYLRYKNTEDVDENLRNTIFGEYNFDCHQDNRQIIDACNDLAIILYDKNLTPLNATPLRVRFKNNSRWKTINEIESYYNKVDIAFQHLLATKGINIPQKQHNQKWRSNILLEMVCKTVTHGASKAKSSPVGEWKITNPNPSKATIENILGVVCNNPEVYQFQQQQLEQLKQYESLENPNRPTSKNTDIPELKAKIATPNPLEDEELEDEELEDEELEDKELEDEEEFPQDEEDEEDDLDSIIGAL